MKQNLLCFFLIGIMLIGSAYAQDRRITGRVTSAADGSPLVGVSVEVSGTRVGTQTDASGSYAINVPEGSQSLVFRYVGFDTRNIAIGSSNTINVVLQVADTEIDEVVIVGYSTTTREAFTGTAKTVSGENIERKAASNISQALAGEVSGVSVINTTGQPGTAATIRIRGFGSVNGNRDPLYVVDGVPFNGNLTSINNSDIESTTVLKDAAATAIYGSRGANGVILINTKTGKRGGASFVEADVNVGTNMNLLPRYDRITSPEEFIGYAWESLYNEGRITGVADPTAYANSTLFGGGRGLYAVNNIWNVSSGADLIDPVTRTTLSGVTRKWDPESWEDYAFQNSARRDISVRFGGNSDRSNYYNSYNYLSDKGYSINSSFERFSTRFNLDNRVKSWLTTGINFNYSRTERHNNGQSSDSGSIFWFMDNIPSIYPLFERDADGNKIPDPIYGGYVFDYGENNNRRFGAMTNSISDATNSVRRQDRNEISGRGYANFNIVKGLTFENSLGINYYNNKSISRNSKFYGSSASTNGSISQTRTENFSFNLLNALRYRNTFGDHSIEAFAAHEAQSWESNVLTASKNQLVRDDSDEFRNAVVQPGQVQSYTRAYTMESFLGLINYDYKGRYYLSGSVRRDGTSRFVNNKWGTFGSVGASWIISNESFMQSQNVFDFLKYKISYGVIGDQSVSTTNYYPGLITYPISNLNDRPSIGVAVVGNPDLSWESAEMFQTGIEFGLGNYLSGAVDYYVKNTTDMIFERRVGPSLGYALINVNDGMMRNSGIEFELTGHVLRGTDYYLNIGVNGESFKNKMVTMPIEPATGEPKIIDIQGNVAYAAGHSIYDYYMRDFVGVDPEDGRSMWKVYYTDTNGNGQYDVGEQIPSLGLFENPNNETILESTTKTYAEGTTHYVGKSSIPSLRGALNLNAGYKNFDLAVQFLYRFGGYAYDGAYASLMHSGLIGGNNWHKDIAGRWQQPGDITDIPRLSNERDASVTSASTRFLTKADYFALNNVRLTYNFSKSLISGIGLQELGIWVSGDNLWISTKRQGFYSSITESGNSSTYAYHPLSTISAGLRVKF